MKKIILALSFLLLPPAIADLDSMRSRAPQIVELKDKGVIGEQADGFLGVVKSEGNAQSVVDSENRDRKEEYQKRATAQGQSLDVFSKVLGEARLRQEKAGRMIKGADGNWTKK